MAGRDEAMETAIGWVELFCSQRTSEHIRVEHERRGRTLTIAERRPPWSPAMGDEWTRQPIAQLRLGDDGAWTLYWPRHTGRWERYDADAASDIRLLLAQIDVDADGVFWG
jgi:hypothetical protein